MGHFLTDGKAIDVVAPAGQYDFGDLFRISLWTGIALDTIATADTVRDLSLECSERIWKVKLPAITPAVGDFLYWTAGTGTKRGDTDLSLTVNGAPAAKVLIAKNAAGYAAVKVNPFAAVA